MVLTKDRLTDILKEKMGFSSKLNASQLLELFLELMKKSIEKEGELRISNFGKWVIRHKKSRPGRNPHTGERIEILPRKVVVFYPSKNLRKLLNECEIN